ncbi:hypothetical protein ES703_22527 [subsurface metagenome]
MLTIPYISKEKFKGKTPESITAQQANLLKGRLKHAMKAEAKAPWFNDPAYRSDIIRFGQEHFFIPETRKPIILEDFQKEKILKPIFYGEDRPTMALVGQTKKSGKSTLAAMISSWFLFQGESYSEIYLAARDKDQASWVVFSKLTKAIRMNPQMLARCKITSDSVELPHKGSILRCLPTEISAAGLNPNLVIFDELWSYDLESMTRFFEELTTVPTRKHPLILVVTYAGYDTDEENLLYSLYQKGQKGGDPTFFFYWSGKNLMPWQTKQYLRQQRGRLRPGTYQRLHLNEWTSGDEPFIDMTEWDEAYIKDLARDYTIKEVRFDPYQFARSSQTLAKLGIKMVEFPQTQDRLTSMSQNLYDLIKGGGLVLYRDRQMRDHAQKATAKETARGWRLTKKKASHKIDLIIALAMAALGATQIKQSRPGRVYVNKGEPLMDWEKDVLNAKREPGKGHVYVG